MAVTRLQERNFSLRSCNSNPKESKALMEKNNSLTQHNTKFERVVGYNYVPNKDLLNITSCSIDKGAKTKRSILVQSAKVFDPLSLYAPITIKSKLSLRSLWRLNFGLGNRDSSIYAIQVGFNG